MTYERVHTVSDYYDGPRAGIADFQGVPHHYVNEYDDDQDDYTDKFMLRPIDDKTFQSIVKQWSIWRAWELAFYSGQRDKSSHPALPGQDETYAQLGIEIKSEIDTNSATAIVVAGNFRDRAGQPELPKGMQPDLEVEWTPHA
ncbi:MAG TPA: hypothetical protein VK629_21435 [Steroidobacteraceae bacterium]|nr:hypothetical protein [Steroidobacteraceae bacterium]